MPAETHSSGDDSVHLPDSIGHFKQKLSFKTEYAPSRVTKYVSERSGLQVFVADRKGPKHLIFMGSKNYHWKGLLDKLASRAYSNTNAWTATDHTAYLLDSIGWDGFAQILPLYLEHVLLPTITNEACTTEVWHVDGEGNDAGVVYSEMQGVQYKSAELMEIAAKRLLYPENVGFRYETGGMMEALRVLTPERIREFHRAMYQPRNLCVIIIGDVNHANLLEILENFEESIKEHIPLWTVLLRDSVQPPPLSETKAEFTDLIGHTALQILLTYVCGSSASILENTIVEKEKLASVVQWYTENRPKAIIWINASGVQTEKLEQVERRITEVLEEVVSKPLDMDYLKACFNREVRQIKFHAEESYSFFSSNILEDYLFGKRDGSTIKAMETLNEYDVLRGWSEEEWRNCLKEYLVDAHHITVFGKPSIEMAKRLKEEETARLAKRKEDLGPQGLEKLGKVLDDAKAKNDERIPRSYRKVAKLEKETVHYSINSARQLGDPDGSAITIALEPEKYSTVIGWLKTLMFQSDIDENRLKALVSKLLADVPESKRDGQVMANEVVLAQHLEETNTSLARRVLVRAVYLKRLKKLLEAEPQKVIDRVKAVYSGLFTRDNLRILVTGDVSKIPNPVTAWDTITRELPSDEGKELEPIPLMDTRLSEEGKNPGSIGAVIIPMTTLDTSFSLSTAKGLTSLYDPRLAALTVAISYLETVEGPLWKAVRGQGFAYGSYFSRDIETGLITYKVYRSPCATKAIAASQETIQAIADGSDPVDEHLMEAAVSQIVMIFAGEQSTMAAAAMQSFVLGVVRALPLDWTEQILAKVRAVTQEEMKAVMQEILLPLFEVGKSNVVITCAQLLQPEIEKALTEAGYKTQVQTLSHYYEAYGLEGDADEDLEDDEDDEDDEEGGDDDDESGSGEDEDEEMKET
ncbi:unnamed protein product [Parascedosporium putredinis]|uniref:Peptidase M16 C-terminal domain-containing protein n=1 Tax=Parascedosporium putredinis TaxID=1442378 RepID=A0A9P1M761_9PEZI|nr:unnamed protein product [Parascedosporium putredinis]CAI7987358.1 unnamed protein product [Parascedosporium putredinis]